MHLKAVTQHRRLQLAAFPLGWSVAFSNRNFCRRAGFAARASHRALSGHKDANSNLICITRKRGRKLHLNPRSAYLDPFPFVSKSPSRAERRRKLALDQRQLFVRGGDAGTANEGTSDCGKWGTKERNQERNQEHGRERGKQEEPPPRPQVVQE